MKALSGKDLCKVLEKHGWVRVRVNGSHHIYTKAGQPETIPVPVHGNRTLKTGTQAGIIKRAGLSKADL